MASPTRLRRLASNGWAIRSCTQKDRVPLRRTLRWTRPVSATSFDRNPETRHRCRCHKGPAVFCCPRRGGESGGRWHEERPVVPIFAAFLVEPGDRNLYPPEADTRKITFELATRMTASSFHVPPATPAAGASHSWEGWWPPRYHFPKASHARRRQDSGCRADTSNGARAS